MTPESVMVMGQEAMRVALMLAAPLLLAALVSGLLISLIQAAPRSTNRPYPLFLRSWRWRPPGLLPARGC